MHRRPAARVQCGLRSDGRGCRRAGAPFSLTAWPPPLTEEESTVVRDETFEAAMDECAACHAR